MAIFQAHPVHVQTLLDGEHGRDATGPLHLLLGDASADGTTQPWGYRAASSALGVVRALPSDIATLAS